MVAGEAGGLCGTLQQWTAKGCGCEETWMPTDDFTRAWRQTRYAKTAGLPSERPPLRMYLDGKLFMQEVTDVTKLRHGDHCVIAVKVARALSPTFDYMTSLASRYGVVSVYHHFVLMDDVAYLDAAGVPRTYQGELVKIMEYTNTTREALSVVQKRANGELSSLLPTTGRFLMDKGFCQMMALTDYGDMPCFFLLLRDLSEGARDKILCRARSVLEKHDVYNAFTNNCEHCVNQIVTGHHSSPQVPLVFRRLGRVGLRILALFSLALGDCARGGKEAPQALPGLCASPAWTMFWHGVGLLTASLPAIARYQRASACAKSYNDSHLVDPQDVRRFMLTERLRLLLVGVGGPAAFVLANYLRPTMPGLAVAMCTFGVASLNAAVTCAAALCPAP